MWNGYGYYASTELWNNRRTVAYLANGLKLPTLSITPGCQCESLDPLFCDQGTGTDGAYTNPAADDAPWYDPLVPDSAEFAGMFVESVTGFDSTLRREVIDGAIGGGTLGPLRRGPRCLTVTGWLFGKTCCGAEYGLQWLTEALTGGACEDCALGDLMMLRCCAPETICGLEQNAATVVNEIDDVTLTITDLGASWRVRVEDPNLTNVIAATLVPGDDGALPVCIGAPVIGEDNAEWTFTYGSTTYSFFMPFATMLSVAMIDPQTYEFDFAKDPQTFGCDAFDDPQAATLVTIAEVWALAGDATPFAVTNSGDIICYSYVPGFDQAAFPIESLPFSNGPEFPRFLHRTGVTSGPEVIDRAGSCCTDCGCPLIQVEFTLCSELPYIFSEIDWCAIDEPFPRDVEYCLDLETLGCNPCLPTTTQVVTREVPRPECPIEIRHDGTWCAVGWDPDTIGVPPEDCLLTVGEAVTFEPDAATADVEPCLVRVNWDGTWEPIRWDPTAEFPPCDCTIEIAELVGPPVECEEACVDPIRLNWDGADLTWEAIGWSGVGEIPPCDCCVRIAEICFPFVEPPDPQTIVCNESDTGRIYYVTISAGGVATAVGWDPLTDGVPPPGGIIRVVQCEDVECCDSETDTTIPTVTPSTGTDFCDIDLTVVNAAGGTWAPVGWSLVDGFPPEFCTVRVQNQCDTPADAAEECAPTSTDDCQITVNADGTYTAINWTLDTVAAFPPPGCAFSIPFQDETPLLREFEFPLDEFIPDCGPLPILPPPPLQLTEQCYCEPWSTYRVCCQLENQKQWSEATTVIELYAGSADARNVKLQAFRNPFGSQGLPCPCDPETDEFWRCRNPCAVVEVSQIPAGSRLTIDSRERTAILKLAGGRVLNGLRFITAEAGSPFDWFDIEACATLCIVVSADACTIAEDATVSVGVAGKYLASGG